MDTHGIPLLTEYRNQASAPTKAQLIESILAHEHLAGQGQPDAETYRPSPEEPTAVVDSDTPGAAEATGGQPADPVAAAATPEADQATETSVDEGREMETVDIGHGIQIPIVPTTGRWIESEVEALIPLAAHPDVGGPCRAAVPAVRRPYSSS